VTQTVKIQMINNAFEVRDAVNELVDRGFSVEVISTGAVAIIEASRLMEGEEVETVH